MDQADTLRKIMEGRQDASADPEVQGHPSSAPVSVSAGSLARTAVFTLSSGRGGVGMSSIVANLGTLLARSGLKVLLVDGGLGLAPLDSLLGVQASVTLEEVLEGRAHIKDAVLEIEQNLWLLPTAAGLLEARDRASDQRDRLAKLFCGLPWEMDLILLDIGAGVEPHVFSLHSPAFESLIVVTPEPASITDAYGLIKLLRRHSGITAVSVIVNQVTDGREGRAIYQKIKDVAARFIDVQIHYLGHLERDENNSQAVRKRKILLDWNPGAGSIRSLELLAKQLKNRFLEDPSRLQRLSVSGLKNGMSGEAAGFWKILLREAPTQPLPTRSLSGLSRSYSEFK